MQTREWKFKEAKNLMLPNGPWQQEYDKKQWLDEDTKYPCLVIRNTLGALCGYVGVPTGHPFFEKHYDEFEKRLDVHGGVTFAEHCQMRAGEDRDPEDRICHIVEEGEDDNVWWIGFDTAHCMDLCPSKLYSDIFTRGGTYRDVEYVEKEVRGLAKQLVNVRAK